MPNILITDTSPADPTGARGQVRTPSLQTLTPGYSYGDATAIMSFGPFQVDQAGNVTTTGTVTSAGGGGAYQFAPEAFGAKRNGRIVSDGVMTSGSNILACATSAPFAVTDIGKNVLVWAAATADTYLPATIAGFTDSKHVTLSASATHATIAGGSGVLFGTDDTAALQAAVNAATAYSLTGNGALAEVVLSEGIYCSATAAVPGTGTTLGNAAIVLPIVTAASSCKAQVRITGKGSSQLPHWLQPVPPQSGSIIAGMRTDGSLDTSFGPTSIIGGPVFGYGGGGGTFSNMHVRLQGLTFLVPVSTGAYCGAELFGVGQATVDDVSYLPLAVVPTSGTNPLAAPWPSLATYGNQTFYPAYSFGLEMPANGNNAVSDIGSFTSYFAQIALIGSEHCNWQSLKTLYSAYGVLARTTSGGGTVTHGIYGDYWCCENVVNPAGSVASGYFALDAGIGINVARCDLEGQTVIVNDAASLLYGEIGFNLIAAPGSYLASQYAAGGTALKLKRLEAAPGPVASPQAVSASTFPWPNYYYRDAWITLSATSISAVTITGPNGAVAQAVPSAAANYSLFVPGGCSYTATYTGTLTHTVSLA